MEFIKKYKYSLILILVAILIGRFGFSKSFEIDSLIKNIHSDTVVLKYDKNDKEKTMSIEDEEEIEKLKELLYGMKIKRVGRKAYVQDKKNKFFILDFGDDLALSFRNERNLDIIEKEKDQLVLQSYRILSGLKEEEIFELFKENTSK